MHHFTANYPDDKAGIIVTQNKGLLIDTWIVFLFYQGLEPPVGVFDNFTAIGPTVDTTKTRPYVDLLKFNNNFILRGQRYLISTETSPLAKDAETGVELFKGFYDHYKDTAKSILETPGLIGSMAFQPVPKTLTKKAIERGGDLLNFSPEHDYVILELSYSYIGAGSDRKVDSAAQRQYGGIDNLVQRYVDEGKLPDVRRPLFMNDAYYRQDYWGRLGEEQHQFALNVRKDVDPEKFFQYRTSGGFRVG